MEIKKGGATDKKGRRLREGCEQCRHRHQKCDTTAPTCGPCASSGRTCTRGLLFKAYKCKFDKRQRFFRPTIDKSNLLIETPETYAQALDDEADYMDHDFDDEPLHPSYLNSPLHFSVRPSSGDSHPHSSPPSLSPSTSFTSPTATDPSHPPFQQQIDEEYPLPLDLPAQSNPLGTIHLQQQVVYLRNELKEQVWPLKTPKQARLYTHYTQELAVWLDLCDPKAHFQNDVAKRAEKCPILLHAIFALSARHLSLTDRFESHISNEYHKAVLAELIPLLSDPNTLKDDNLFAATIILRVLEEIELPNSPSPTTQVHLTGISAFVNMRNSTPTSPRGGLEEAAFWVGLRQEIYYATMNHTNIRINLEHLFVDRSVSATDDFGWANRAVVHCADVLNFCFGGRSNSSGDVSSDGRSRSNVNNNNGRMAAWNALCVYEKAWNAVKSSSFEPTFERDAGLDNWGDEQSEFYRVFPNVQYRKPCHVIGITHMLLAQILLLVHDPHLANLSQPFDDNDQGKMIMEQEVRNLLKRMCGVALNNQWTRPGLFTACMGIGVCGEIFVDLQEQNALMRLLELTEKKHARPTKEVQQKMEEAWGWISV